MASRSDKNQRSVIYAVLFALLFLELLLAFFPSITSILPNKIGSIMNDHARLILMVAALLAFFRHFDKHLIVRPYSSFVPALTFNQGVSKTLGKENEIKSIDLVAHTGTMYYYAFQQSGARVKDMRLLLRGSASLETLGFPTQEKAKEKFEREVADMAENWQKLQEEGRIVNLEIAFYPFDNICHFMIVNDVRLYFGLFRPCHDTTGTKVLNSFSFDNNTPEGAKFIEDFKTDFEFIWAEFKN